MLEEIKIQNFRGIREGHVKDFGPVNIFVGPNGSGKSSLLEAIFAGSTGPQLRNGNAEIRNRDLMGKRRGEGHFPSADIVFGKDPQKKVKIEYHESERDHPVSWVASFSPQGAKVRWEVNGQQKNDGSPNSVENGELLDVSVLFSSESEKRWWDDLLNIRGDRELVKALKEVYQIEIESFSYTTRGAGLKTLFSDRDFALKIDDLAAGIRIAFRIFAAVRLASNSRVLVEEFDGYQHVESFPRFAKVLLKLAHDSKTQLFMATHNLESIRFFLNAAEDLEFEGLNVFQTRLDANGAFDAVRLTMKDARTLLDGGVDIRKVD